jgi:translation initiation factor IF-2
MKDWTGQPVEEAPPGTPVKVIGFKVAPQVGDIVEVPEEGKKLAAVKKEYGGERQAKSAPATPAEGEEEEGVKTLNVVLKADVLGSLEAIVGTLEKYVTPDVSVKIVQKGLGNITEGDVMSAEASEGLVYGFNVQATREAEILAKDKGIDVKTYRVIYEMFDDAKDRLQALLPVEVIRNDLGKMEVLANFKSGKGGQVIGGRVSDGRLVKGANAVVFRGEQPIGEGRLVQLQAGKTDVNEVRQGQECGVKITCKTPIEPGDIVQVFTEERKERKLELPK